MSTHTGITLIRMTAIHHLLTSAIDAALSGRHVDVVGPRLSGRTTLLRQVSERLRDAGWEVHELSGSGGGWKPAPTLVQDFSSIAVDDWDLLDDEARSLVGGTGAVIVATRAAGEPASRDMHTVQLPPISAETLRALLVKKAGVLLAISDVEELVHLTDGAAGAAVRIVGAAREQGTLAVAEGRGSLHGSWVDAAGSTASLMLDRLDDSLCDALARIARGAGSLVPATDVTELSHRGYIDPVTGELSSTLLRTWFNRP